MTRALVISKPQLDGSLSKLSVKVSAAETNMAHNERERVPPATRFSGSSQRVMLADYWNSG